PRVQWLRRGRAERHAWQLLLQTPSLVESDMEWGAWGYLYLYIRRADLEQGDFSRVWTLLQCG
ncbi:MAG: DUF1963 domain-containing protein, partial [Planctomycetota bacterium]